jgi:triphosphatase
VVCVMFGQTELKFAVNEVSKPAVAAAFGPTEQPSTYETIYFDTDNLDLRRHRIELCLRHSAVETIQTIKAPKNEGIKRPKHEIKLDDLQLRFDHARAFLPASLRHAISGSMIKPRFRTNFSRIRYSFACGLDAWFDVGFIEAAGSRESVAEVAFEARDCELDCYSKECLAFLDRVPASIVLESNAARGYRLASGELPQPAFAESISIAPLVPLPDAILRIFRHGFAHFLNNQPAIALTGISEAIHQMRVGIRRLRSAIHTFRPVLCLDGGQDLLSATKSLFAKLGEVRDADVFLRETLESVTKAGLGESRESLLREEIKTYRDSIYRALRDELMSPNFARLVVRLNTWIEGGRWLKAEKPIDALLAERAIEEFAVPRIITLRTKMLKRGRDARHGSVDDWHRVRIAVKRLRYGGEPLYGASPKVDRKFSRRLGRLQTSLGRLNDLETVGTLLSRVQPNVRAANRREFAAAQHFCLGWSGATAAMLRQDAETAMEDFDKTQLMTF